MQQKMVKNDETAEIERLRFLKQREEYEALRKQKHNIQQLKEMQTNGVVQENPTEEDAKSFMDQNDENHQNSTVQEPTIKTSNALENTSEVHLDYEGAPQMVYANNSQQTTVVHEASTQEVVEATGLDTFVENKPDARSHESDDDQDDPMPPDDDGHLPDPPSAEKPSTSNQDSNLFMNRSKSDQMDEIPANVVMADSGATPTKKGAKKVKNKGKPIPKTIKRIFPNVTDLSAWRKRNHLGTKTRIFKMFGNYTSIKKALYDRGWVENKDKTSPCFDLLWSLKCRDIDFDNLRDGQIVNHFRYNGCITTKIGLCRNIGKVINFNNVDVDTFFPKCYAFKEIGEFDQFCEEFKLIKAHCILKKFVKDENIDPDMLDIAMTVCRRNLLTTDDIIDHPISKPVRETEWHILSKDERKYVSPKKAKRGKQKATSLVPVRKTQSKFNPAQPNKNSKLNSKRGDMYKSPSIVTLKLPEIENKQMYNTLKDNELLQIG